MTSDHAELVNELRANADFLDKDSSPLHTDPSMLREAAEMIEVLVGTVELVNEALVKHDEWCGHRAQAPGNPVIRDAERAIKDVLRHVYRRSAYVTRVLPRDISRHLDAKSARVLCDGCDFDDRSNDPKPAHTCRGWLSGYRKGTEDCRGSVARLDAEVVGLHKQIYALRDAQAAHIRQLTHLRNADTALNAAIEANKEHWDIALKAMALGQVADLNRFFGAVEEML